MKNQTFVYRIAALVSYPVGYFYVRYVLFGITGTHEQIWPLLFSILLIACVEVFCCAAGKSRSVLASCGQSAGESVFFAACARVQSSRRYLFCCTGLFLAFYIDLLHSVPHRNAGCRAKRPSVSDRCLGRLVLSSLEQSVSPPGQCIQKASH